MSEYLLWKMTLKKLSADDYNEWGPWTSAIAWTFLCKGSILRSKPMATNQQ
jgi:hypothetical protein